MINLKVENKRLLKNFGIGRISLIVVVCFGILLTSNAQVTDNFTDGDFTTNPTWEGDTSSYEVDGSFQLHLNAIPTDSTTSLTTPSQSMINATWEFWVNMGFATSSSSYINFYLASDNANLQNAVNGYFVQVGNSDDEVSLYRQDGATKTEILDGLNKRVGTSSVTAKVKVTRDNLGNWEVFVDSTGGSNFVSEGTVLDNTYGTSEYVGVQCVYIASRSTKYYFDSISVTGTFIVDTFPPEIISVSAISDTSIDVLFDENVDQVTAEVLMNYVVDGGQGFPTSAVLDGADGKLVHLGFGGVFSQSTDYILTVNNVEDAKGNAISNEQFAFKYFIPGYRDIVINEIFPDPDPVIGLPGVEYIELYNASSGTVDLTGMQFSDGGSSVAILSSYTLLPNEFVIICPSGEDTAFASWGPAMGVSNFPSLNNSGDALQLLMKDSTVMDEVTYSSSWYGDAIKDDGGYSLELIDPSTPCSGQTNWSASEDVAGGTPGRINSIKASNPDLTAPTIAQAVAINDSEVLLQFSEKMNVSTIILQNITIDNGVTIDSQIIGSGLSTDTLFLGSILQPKTVYTLTIMNATDCSGNMMSSDNNTVTFALPEEAAVGDLIINEVLFNPRSGSKDFIEIYNNSDKYIDLKYIDVLTIDTGGYDKFKISSDFLVLAPESYLAISEDILDLTTQYPNGHSENFHQIADLPSYNDSDGEVLIGRIDVTNPPSGILVLDSFYYEKEMHIALLDDENGVSLERIDFDQPSTNAENWHSAAEVIGFATPGYLNSQSFTISGLEGQIVINPEVFTPDGDGVNDFTSISYDFETSGNIANITVFDSYGRFVKYIAQNKLLGTEGFFQWDGINEDGRKALVGNYVVLFEIFNTSGNRQQFKKIISVGAQF